MTPALCSKDLIEPSSTKMGHTEEILADVNGGHLADSDVPSSLSTKSKSRTGKVQQSGYIVFLNISC